MAERSDLEQTAGASATPRILVVDDVAANLDVLREVLEPEGYQVLMAPGGEVALRNAQRALPDLILLDVMMPDLNGYEVCRRLKQEEETASIPVIFITANDDTEALVTGSRGPSAWREDAADRQRGTRRMAFDSRRRGKKCPEREEIVGWPAYIE
jgi:CheY-like chemotaxis protein